MTVKSTVARIALFVLLLPVHAWAVDGVIEINQARALAGGVTPSDTAGFPVTIDSAGSYRLTSDLVVSIPGADGILINANSENGPATLDLNGFAVRGLVSCTNTDDTGATITCDPSDPTSNRSTGLIIASKNVTIQNGTVTGFGFRGIGNSGNQGNIRIDNLLVTSNSIGGTGCAGISFDNSPNVTIINTKVVRNGACRAIEVTNGAQIIDSIVAENGGEGIFSFFGNHLLRGNTVRANAQSGMQIDAFTSGDISMVIDNIIVDNGVFGIDGNVAYSGNVINGNGATVQGGSEFGTNYCDGNTTCP